MIWQISIREGMKAAEQRMCKNIIRFFYNDKVEQRFPNPDYPAVLKREDFVIDIDAYSMGIIYHDDLAQFIDDMPDTYCSEYQILPPN